MAGKILKFLPKAASFSIPNHNSSNNNKTKHKYAFSGPLLPMIPDHCRRKRFGMLEEEEEEEPTSPKVSCIGQVNRNSKKKSNSKKNKKTASLVTKEEEQQKKKKKEAPKRSTSSIGLMFWRKAAKPAARRGVEDESSDEEFVGAPAAAGIGRMRRYASGRVEALKDFDWRTIVDQNNEEEKEEEQLVPHSAPILVGVGAVAAEPKKEMSIWMRRTRTPPVPLQVN